MVRPLPLFPTAVIGSMPRPQYVKDLLLARTTAGTDLPADLLIRTDDAVRFVIGLQEQAGIDMVSDGEWRRETYIDVIAEICRGFEWIERELFGYHQVVTSAMTPWQPGIVAAEARFLRENTERAVKVALPSPYLIGQRMWDPNHSTVAYPTRDIFCEALVPVLREELLAVREIGVDLIQLDEPHLCVLVDPEVRATFDDPGGGDAQGGRVDQCHCRWGWRESRWRCTFVAATGGVRAGERLEVTRRSWTISPA